MICGCAAPETVSTAGGFEPQVYNNTGRPLRVHVQFRNGRPLDGELGPGERVTQAGRILQSGVFTYDDRLLELRPEVVRSAISRLPPSQPLTVIVNPSSVVVLPRDEADQRINAASNH